jgi:hypothetical protein
MKKSLALISSMVIFLSACGESSNTPVLINDFQQVQTFSADEQENEKLANENSQDIEAVSKAIFSQYFADEISVDISKNAVPVQNKGGFLFNLLNKSKIAQKVGYMISNYPVKAKFNKHGVADKLPRINEQQTNELLNVLKPGDIILCGNDDSFVHAILYTGNGGIVHSLASKNPKFWGVVKEPLTQYLKKI